MMDLMERGVIPSVSEVAEAAGVSRATAYRYFPSQAAMSQAAVGEAPHLLVLRRVVDREENFGDVELRILRVLLEALYRLVDLFGMTDLTYNHITARIPGTEDHLLINLYGLLYREITASSLVKIDIEGNELDFIRHEGAFLRERVRAIVLEWHKWQVTLPEPDSSLA